MVGGVAETVEFEDGGVAGGESVRGMLVLGWFSVRKGCIVRKAIGEDLCDTCYDQDNHLDMGNGYRERGYIGSMQEGSALLLGFEISSSGKMVLCIVSWPSSSSRSTPRIVFTGKSHSSRCRLCFERR